MLVRSDPLHYLFTQGDMYLFLVRNSMNWGYVPVPLLLQHQLSTLGVGTREQHKLS